MKNKLILDDAPAINSLQKKTNCHLHWSYKYLKMNSLPMQKAQINKKNPQKDEHWNAWKRWKEAVKIEVQRMCKCVSLCFYQYYWYQLDILEHIF